MICASPDYLRQHGTPAAPADLKQHRIVTSTSAWASPEWRFADGQRVVVDAALQTNTNEAAISTARQGWGLTRVLAYQVAADLQAGRLQRVMREFEEPPLPIHVLYPEGRRSPAKVRAFIDLAVSRLRAHPAFH